MTARIVLALSLFSMRAAGLAFQIPRSTSRRSPFQALGRRATVALQGTAPELEQPEKKASGGQGSEKKRDRLVVRFDDRWVDLTAWRNVHPAGSMWIEEFKGLDATEVMHAFHSEEALSMLKRLPTAKDADIPGGVAEVTPLTRAFRKLRASLLSEGLFKRSMKAEAFQLLSWGFFLGLGVMGARSLSVEAQALGVIALAVANSYAGWLGHDYVHGTDRFCARMRHFGAAAAGLGATMWSDKHNIHHAKTNEVGIDQDLPGGPVLFIWPPATERDRPWRKVQHLYLPVAYSLLFVLWRVDSFKVAWKRKLWPEVAALSAHYAWALALIPPHLLLGAVLVSGLMSATIVTVSHQTEDLHFKHMDDWVRNQFVSTRDCITSNPFSEWLWGGMQYQLIHHLFPTMPRYRYPALVPRIEAFAREHGVEYRRMAEFPLLARNYGLYRQVAKASADPNARASVGGVSV
mmetsp:Transcript_29651/g.66474  ORF Transcript_29651/g.66474 Transcript_29651/m.66474 type:complete len:462 (+) Transcript_29651:87-1472(+)